MEDKLFTKKDLKEAFDAGKFSGRFDDLTFESWYKTYNIEDIKYVALFIADDGQSTGICKRECTDSELEKLKSDHKNDYISLIGWMPIELYIGGDVDETDEHFTHYN